MHFRIPYSIGTVRGERAFLHIDGHTDAIGHTLITDTLGTVEIEKRLRDVLGEIARDIEKDAKRQGQIE